MFSDCSLIILDIGGEFIPMAVAPGIPGGNGASQEASFGTRMVHRNTASYNVHIEVRGFEAWIPEAWIDEPLIVWHAPVAQLDRARLS